MLRFYNKMLIFRIYLNSNFLFWVFGGLVSIFLKIQKTFFVENFKTLKP